MIEVDPLRRDDILRFASRVTTLWTDPRAVSINAGPLLAWLEDARCIEDQVIRYQALHRHYANLCGGAVEDADADNPQAFLEKAKVYYAFTTAGSQS